MCDGDHIMSGPVFGILVEENLLNDAVKQLKDEIAKRTEKPTLNEQQWKLLEEAENRLYINAGGMNGFTHVLYREDSDWLVPMWSQAVQSCEMEFTTPEAAERSAAWRVAQALMLLSFGADSLLR